MHHAVTSLCWICINILVFVYLCLISYFLCYVFYNYVTEHEYVYVFIYACVYISGEKYLGVVVWDRKHFEKAGRTNFGMEHPQVIISSVAYPRKLCRFSKLQLD